MHGITEAGMCGIMQGGMRGLASRTCCLLYVFVSPKPLEEPWGQCAADTFQLPQERSNKRLWLAGAVLWGMLLGWVKGKISPLIPSPKGKPVTAQTTRSCPMGISLPE